MDQKTDKSKFRQSEGGQLQGQTESRQDRQMETDRLRTKGDRQRDEDRKRAN